MMNHMLLLKSFGPNEIFVIDVCFIFYLVMDVCFVIDICFVMRLSRFSTSTLLKLADTKKQRANRYKINHFYEQAAIVKRI